MIAITATSKRSAQPYVTRYSAAACPFLEFMVFSPHKSLKKGEEITSFVI
jgi:hypothetical protein